MVTQAKVGVWKNIDKLLDSEALRPQMMSHTTRKSTETVQKTSYMTYIQSMNGIDGSLSVKIRK